MQSCIFSNIYCVISTTSLLTGMCKVPEFETQFETGSQQMVLKKYNFFNDLHLVKWKFAYIKIYEICVFTTGSNCHHCDGRKQFVQYYCPVLPVNHLDTRSISHDNNWVNFMKNLNNFSTIKYVAIATWFRWCDGRNTNFSYPALPGA